MDCDIKLIDTTDAADNKDATVVNESNTRALVATTGLAGEPGNKIDHENAENERLEEPKPKLYFRKKFGDVEK